MMRRTMMVVGLFAVGVFSPASAEANDWRTTYDAGHAAIETAQYDKAIALFEQASKLSNTPKGKSPAANGIGLAYMRSRRWAEAVGPFSRAIELDADNNTARKNLASVHIRMYQLGAAGKDVLERAITALQPLGSHPLLDLANALKQQEATWAAAGEAPSTCEGNTWRGFVNAGDAAYDAGQLQFAIRCFERAENIAISDASKGSAANRIGLTHLRAHHFDAAIAAFERAVAAMPREKIFINNLATAQLRLYESGSTADHLNDALANFRRVQEIAPGYQAENLQVAELYEAKSAQPAAVPASPSNEAAPPPMKEMRTASQPDNLPH